MGSSALEPDIQAGTLTVTVNLYIHNSILDSARAGIASLLLVLTLSLFSMAAQAKLVHDDTVELAPGEMLAQNIEWQKSPGQRVEIKLAQAPVGAKLLVNQSGQLYVSWQTSPDLPQESTLVLLVRDVDTSQVLVESQLLVLRRVAPEAAAKPSEPAELPLPPELPSAQTNIDTTSSAEVIRPRFKPFKHQYLQVGVPWHIEIDVESMSAEPLRLLVKVLPEGAMMSIAPDGSYDIDWTPGQAQLGKHTVALKVVDADQPDVFAEQQLRLTVKPNSLAQKNSVKEAVSREAPLLNAMPNQVVSAGRVVSFQLKPTLDDGELALLQIDRLPRNASFDENEDGSRTFYWQTSDKDQGEHLFRFTAVHPQNGDLRTWREILIVVGDPSRSSTAPVNTAQGSVE